MSQIVLKHALRHPPPWLIFDVRQKNMTALEKLRSEFFRLAEVIDAPRDYVDFRTSPENNGGAHVECSGRQYYYVTTERGIEFERRQTQDLDEILYWLIADLTFAMAVRYELNHRRPDQDFRILLFTQHVDLLRRIKPAWAETKHIEYNKIIPEYKK